MKYLGTFETDGLGVIRFRDVVLPAGDYLLVLAPYADHPFPYRLDVLRSSSSGVDPEPNDDPTVAAPLDPGRLAVRGRLTLGDPRDRYLLTVDGGLAGRLLDIRLIWRDGPQRQLCLEATDARPIQCRNGDRGVSLTGLSLAPGPYVVEVQETRRPTPPTCSGSTPRARSRPTSRRSRTTRPTAPRRCPSAGPCQACSTGTTRTCSG